MFPVGIHLNELNNFNRIGIAFSGGLDSSALLKYVTENFPSKEKIYALHINHGISKHSDTWEDFCRDQASILECLPRDPLRQYLLKIYTGWGQQWECKS